MRRDVIRTILIIVGVAIAYFAAGRTLLALSAPPNGAVLTVWLPSGISVAALVLFGPRAALGSFVGSLAFELTAGTPLAGGLVVGMAKAGGDLLCYYLIVGRARREFSMDLVGAVVRLMMAALVGAAVSASIGVTVYVIVNVLPVAFYWSSWLTWFGSTAIGIVLIAPSLIYAVRFRRSLGSVARYVEFAAAIVALAISAFMWQEPTLADSVRHPLVLLIILVFIWIAFRFQPAEMTFAVLIFAVAAVGGAVWQASQVLSGEEFVSIFALQIQLGGLGAIGFFLASMVAGQQRAGEKLRLAAAVFENANDGIVITLPSGEIVDVNDAFVRMHGFTREETIGRNPRVLRSDRHPPEFYRELWDTLTSTGQWQGEIWDRRPDGSLLPKWLSIAAVKSADSVLTHYVGVSSDMTSIKKGEERLRWLATHDPLTRLPNRALVDDRLEGALQRARRLNTAVGLMFIDLDHFKDVNDTRGHVQGDQLLVEVGQRVAATLRQSDTLGRRGGDEFSLIVPDLADTSSLEGLASRILAAIEEPFQLDSGDAHVSASIGVAVFPTDGESPEHLMQRADIAMYRAKELGRGRIQFFSSELQQEVLLYAQVERDLRSALEEERFVVNYQPQVDLISGRIVGLEALVRMRAEDGTLVQPDRFIPVAEESGLIVPLGNWVLRTACSDLAGLRRAGYDLTMAVNFSARQLRETHVTALVLAVLSSNGLEPRDLDVEITETALLRDVPIAQIDELRDAGVVISLDDFGTGYSSLTHVRLFRAAKLKIDKAFVNEIMTEPGSKAIVLTTIALAKSTGAKVVAEGPETEEQVRFLRDSGCDYGQGYYFSRPVTLDAMAELLKAGAFALPG